MKRALEEMSAFTQSLIQMAISPEALWFKNLLVGLLNSTWQNYRSVEIGVKNMPTLAAWGARNLLERRVITAYVLRSEADALNFKDDFASDLKEFWEAMKASGEYGHSQTIREMRSLADTSPEPFKSAFLAEATEMELAGPDLSGPMEEMDTYRKLMDEFGIDAKRRPASGTKIAEFVQQSDIYKPRFKVHSKLVHPTALSIAAATTEDSLTALMPLFHSEASTDLIAIFYDIKRHVESFGVGWAPVS
jgi:hypothetical protein